MGLTFMYITFSNITVDRSSYFTCVSNRYMYCYHWLFPVVVVLVLGTESVVGVLELLVVIKVVLKLGIVVAVVNTLRKFGV